VICARRVFLRDERPSQNGPCAQRVEPLPGHQGSLQPLRQVAFGVAEIPGLQRRRRRENLPAVADIGVVRRRDADPRQVQLEVVHPDGHQLRGIGDSRRMQKERVDHAEDGRIGRDAQRQREHRHGGESWSLAQRAQPVAQILSQSGQHARTRRPRNHRAAIGLLHLRHPAPYSAVAQAGQRRAPCIFRGLPRRELLPITLVQVLPQFFAQRPFARRSKFQVFQAFADLRIPLRHFQLLQSGSRQLQMSSSVPAARAAFFFRLW